MDEHAVRELELYTMNTWQAYKTWKNAKDCLSSKISKGVYDSEKAKKLMFGVASHSAKMYWREHGGGCSWHACFPADVRREAAKYLLSIALDEIEENQ